MRKFINFVGKGNLIAIFGAISLLITFYFYQNLMFVPLEEMQQGKKAELSEWLQQHSFVASALFRIGFWLVFGFILVQILNFFIRKLHKTVKTYQQSLKQAIEQMEREQQSLQATIKANQQTN